MEEIRRYLFKKQDEMLQLLEGLVNIDSGSYCKEGIDACGQILHEHLRGLGFETEVITEMDYGNHIKAKRTGKGTKRLFISCHLDTVWPAGTVTKSPFRIDGGLAYGPGVGDMKGGIVVMIYALKALHDLGQETLPISVFLTGDEELGSVRGRPYIEEEARQSAWVLVMESSHLPGVIVVKRWGVGAFYLTIHGKAAHVMDMNKVGVNACRELALKILALESLSDPLSGVKVSVNLVEGGVSRQTTAPRARADIDVRVREAKQIEAIEKKIEQIAGVPFLPGIEIEFKGEFTRPPMEMNSSTEAFLRLATEVGREIGMDFQPGTKGGGSDGCFTAALGVATLDGMGPLCYDFCSDTERIEMGSLLSKTLFMAAIIQHLSKEA
ncbi:MAG: hypothetical protein A2156_00590 [Deltaproteobacteria bacterium RBG_16_48_10]|nr:MAG: hypothetical protein A2156_00590 [Deltaproteobacteria bacterium RBG_16_48_10]